MKKWIQNNFYILVAFYAMGAFLANDMFLPAISDIARDFHTENDVVSMGLGAYLLGSFLLQILAGPISDRYGRRLSLIGGGIFFLLATLGIIFSTNIVIFLFFRFLQGVGTCMFSAAGLASLNEYYSGEKAVMTISITVNLIMLSPIMGPIIGTLIIKFLPWKWIFVSNFIFMCLVVFSIYLFMPETANMKNSDKISFLGNFRGVYLTLCNKKFMTHSLALALHSGMYIFWLTLSNHILIDNRKIPVEKYSFYQAPFLLAYILGNTIAPRLSRYGDHKDIVQRVSIVIGGVSLFFMGGVIFLGVNLYFFPIIFGTILFLRGLLNSHYSKKILSLETRFQGSSASSMQLSINGVMAIFSFAASNLYGLTNKNYTLIMLFIVMGSASLSLSGTNRFKIAKQRNYI